MARKRTTRRRTTRRRTYSPSYQASRTSGNGAMIVFFLIVAAFVWMWSAAQKSGGQKSIADIMQETFPDWEMPSYNFGNVSSLFYHDWSNPDQSATYGVQFNPNTDWTQPSQPVTYGVNYQFNSPYL